MCIQPILFFFHYICGIRLSVFCCLWGVPQRYYIYYYYYYYIHLYGVVFACERYLLYSIITIVYTRNIMYRGSFVYYNNIIIPNAYWKGPTAADRNPLGASFQSSVLGRPNPAPAEGLASRVLLCLRIRRYTQHI